MSTTKTLGRKTARMLDQVAYGKLLTAAQPVFPRTPTEHKRLVKELDALMRKPQNTAEENELLQVLATLISRYERERFVPELARPNEVLEFLMEENKLRQRDLLDIFPSRSRISEALAGTRAITHDQASKLGKRFRVDPSLFLDIDR